jgi:response regulator NasT
MEEEEMRTRVLIADDDVRFLKLFSEYLDDEGYCVVGQARDGAEACELCAELRPDLAILDMDMPGMDGIQAARVMMRDNPLPIIMVTGHYGSDIRVRAAESGIFGCLSKPVDFDELSQMMLIALNRFAEMRKLRAEVTGLENALEARKIVEKAKGIVMMARNLTEGQAHHYLQTESQRQSRPLVELARAIVTAHQVSCVKILGQASHGRTFASSETR